MPRVYSAPWDRSGVSFRKPKHRYEYAFHHHHHNNHLRRGGGGGGRWSESSSSFHRLFHGHGKQGGRHLYQDESPPWGCHTSRSADRFLDEDCFRPPGPQRNCRFDRFYRDNCDDSGHREWRGHSWQNKQQNTGPANTPGKPPIMNDNRSVGDSPVRPSRPNSDPSAQFHSKDQTDKIDDANGSGVSQIIGKENSLETRDWKPLKSSYSGSMTSRSAGFIRSSSSKLTRGASGDVKDDLDRKSVPSIRSPFGDALTCAPSPDPPEETAFQKKPRLSWGQGLSKFEKKKVGGPDEDVITIEKTTTVGNVKPTHPFISNPVDKSPNITGFSGCSFPATPLSFTSPPALEEKTYVRATDGDTNNFSASSVPLFENEADGMQFNLEKLELKSVTKLRSLLDELLLLDGRSSMGSGFKRSSASNMLLLWKKDISKSIEMTETEIEFLENELNLLKGDLRRGILCPSWSNSSHIDADCDGLNDFCRRLPDPFKAVSVEGMIVENKLPNHCAREGEDLFACDSKKKTFGTYCLGDEVKAIKDHSVASIAEHPGVCDMKEFKLCDTILASNKETASKASGLLSNLLPRVENGNIADGMNAFRLSYLPSEARIKKQLLRRRQLLKLKERVLSLKHRAFYHFWKEDLRLLSLSRRTKPHKKLDVNSKTMQTGNRKHRLSIRPHLASSAGSLSLVPSIEILNSIGKLLSDGKVKIDRNSLKMPAMILDEKDKVSSRFLSTNGLVEDPCAAEKERALFNPWTIKEKEIFFEKLAFFGKDFRKIGSFLDYKTVADCIQFYYKNHKSQSFVKTKKLDAIKQAKPLSLDTYMLTSEKEWGREWNFTSLDVLGAATVMAAQADQAMKTSKFKPRGPRHAADNDQDTVAADHLAGIHGSMSSCTTRFVDPTDGRHDWRPQKVDSSSARQPLKPKNVNDADIYCGGVDPVDWTHNEKLLFLRAFLSFGKDFVMISRSVRTKTRHQCKVFFSKARKRLDLENLHPESCPGKNDTNDTYHSESNVEDDDSIVCCDNSDSRTDDDLPHMSQDVSMPNSTSNGICGAWISDCKDTNVEPEVVCPGGNLTDFSDFGHGEVVNDNQRIAQPMLDLETKQCLSSRVQRNSFQAVPTLQPHGKRSVKSSIVQGDQDLHGVPDPDKSNAMAAI
ncbi:hypothetical protein vseg_002715 [Gypsophila vaccaria]